MATAIAARHVYKHRGTGLTGHCRPACAESRPRRRQRPTALEHCSNAVFDGLPAQTICIKFDPETSEVFPQLFLPVTLACAGGRGRRGEERRRE